MRENRDDMTTPQKAFITFENPFAAMLAIKCNDNDEEELLIGDKPID